MKYKKRHFYIENVSAKIIAKKFGTPSYVYSYDKIKNNINNFKKNFKTINPLICFSVKSNCNLKILNLINKFGLGADVVSKGELIIALKAKIKPHGDLLDHYRDYGPGYDPIYALPSIKVKLIKKDLFIN